MEVRRGMAKLVHNVRHRLALIQMVTGNMGSSMRMNYTMMGDTVNLALDSSLQKQYGVYTFVAENIQVMDQFEWRLLDSYE